MTQSPSLMESWQRHVLDCVTCSRASSDVELCQMGRNFWRVPSSPAAAPQAAATATTSPQPVSAALSPVSAGIPSSQLDIVAQRVRERVLAQTERGHQIAVPREKTSRLVSFSTAPGVVLSMPERDISVYDHMRSTIPYFVWLADRIAAYTMVVNETKRISRANNLVLNDDELGLVVRRAGGGAGGEDLFGDVERGMQHALQTAEIVANLMRVDDEARMLMQSLRGVAMMMREQLERSIGGLLVVDDETRQVIRSIRNIAIAMQGELERRLGT